jgi:diguanylate cyclase (GGDEF)-like protein
MRLTLRVHLLLWQLAVIAPLLLAALLHHFYLMPRFIHPLQKITEEYTDEVLLIERVQSTLNMSTIHVSDYLNNGQRSELEQFASQRQRVDQRFAAVRAIPFGENQRQLVASAWDEWGQAQQLVDELLDNTAHPVGMAGRSEKVERFQRHIDVASVKLEELYNFAHQQVKTAKTVARSAQAEMRQLTVAAFIIAFVISGVIGSALIRSVLRNLESMRNGARQIAAGELEQPVHAGGIQELEQLADSFNVMAMKLQVHDAVLQDLAIHDALTGLANRRMFDTRIDEEMQRVLRYHHPLSLLMLDIDHFKLINDSYGHLAGDAVLRKLAATIMGSVRPVDRVFRYGGEEFAVLVPETDAEGALSLAERIREIVAATLFPVSADTEINLTMSIGITTCHGEVVTKEDLIANADKALYQAKQTGRNRVCSSHYQSAANAHLAN